MHSSEGGCFFETALFEMENGDLCSACSLVKGDVMKGGFKVECVIASKIGELSLAYRLGDKTEVTAYHPFRYKGGAWCFPIEHMKSVRIDERCVYNLVLDRGHVVTDGRHEFVTLGHGMKGAVVEHPFFGGKIVDELKKMDGWNDGYIELRVKMTRGKDGLVNGFDV